MPSINVRSWESFEKKLKTIRESERQAERRTEFLFRGLSNSAWPLATTLERAGRTGMVLSDYYRLISSAKPHTETFTGSRWEIERYPDVVTLLQSHDGWALHKFPNAVQYSYMVYLRHHGFPSPLLDWTRTLHRRVFCIPV